MWKENALRGFMYDERVKSFVLEGNWPYSDPTTHNCTAEELALAGFYWTVPSPSRRDPDPDPVAKCFACDLCVIVHDFGRETDPWALHRERSPKCPYIGCGRKRHAREYKFREIYEILMNRETVTMAKSYCEKETLVKAAFFPKPESRSGP